MKGNKPAEGEQQHPLCPLAAVRSDHPVRDQQQAESRIGERRRERSRVRQAANGAFEEKSAVQMEDDTREADEDREPANEMADVAPHRRRAAPEGESEGEDDGRSDRKIEGNVFGPSAEAANDPARGGIGRTSLAVAAVSFVEIVNPLCSCFA